MNLSRAQQNEVKKEKGTTTDHTVIVPPHVSASAKAAVQKLGDKIKVGDFMYGYNTMYDRYKKRQEKLHGKQELQNQILNAQNKMLKMGVTIESFNAEKPTGYFRVHPMIKPDVKAKLATGELKQTKPGDEYYHWMIIVPTTQIWKFLDKNGKPPRYLKREQYQIAIAAETDLPGQEKWTFIGSLKEQQLRSLFPSLPQNIELPLQQNSEIKK